MRARAPAAPAPARGDEEGAEAAAPKPLKAPQSSRRRRICGRACGAAALGLVAAALACAVVGRSSVRIDRALTVERSPSFESEVDAAHAAHRGRLETHTCGVSVDDALGGATVKFVLDDCGGTKALFKPLRTAFSLIGDRRSPHREQPLGELLAYHVGRRLGVRLPAAALYEVDARQMLRAVDTAAAMRALLSRCPQFVSESELRTQASFFDKTAFSSLVPLGCVLRDRASASHVLGVAIAWHANLRPLSLIGRPVLFASRLRFVPKWLKLSLMEKAAWSDLEALDAIMGNWDRAKHLFFDGARKALVPIDHNHITGRAHTVQTQTWRWCGHSDEMRIALARLRGALHGQQVAKRPVFAAVLESVLRLENATLVSRNNDAFVSMLTKSLGSDPDDNFEYYVEHHLQQTCNQPYWASPTKGGS